jgi:hypothetical protein
LCKLTVEFTNKVIAEKKSLQKEGDLHGLKSLYVKISIYMRNLGI